MLQWLTPTELVGWVLATLFLQVIFLTIFGRRLHGSLPGRLATTSMLISLVGVTVLAVQCYPLSEPLLWQVGSWLNIAGIDVPWALQLDHLTLLMLLLVCFVGFLVHWYSIGYMSHEEGTWRYFAALQGFCLAMLLLLLADHFLLLFLGWEGVGLCSYLLIGYWYKDLAKTSAARKAFLFNRLGDLGLLTAMGILLTQAQTLSLSSLSHNMALSPVTLQWLTGALLLAACGKSAQLPLAVWLPDAMAGPTPVSALMHAATMVTAGIYLLCRCSFLFLQAPEVLAVVGWIGIVTSLTAAISACFQTDIKKILAYSTISQLGLMVLGVGAGAFSAAMLHVVMHGFFKAALFLAAGALIHLYHGEQDLQKLRGRAANHLSIQLAFCCGGAALLGFPLSAGFVSKDTLLSEVALLALYPSGHRLAFLQPQAQIWSLLAFVVCLLTVYYTSRLLLTLCLPKDGAKKDEVEKTAQEKKAQKAGSGLLCWSMAAPLLLLSLLSLLGGLLAWPEALGGNAWLLKALEPVLATPWLEEPETGYVVQWLLMAFYSAPILLAFVVWWQLATSPQAPSEAAAAAVEAKSSRLRIGLGYWDLILEKWLIAPYLWFGQRILQIFLEDSFFAALPGWIAETVKTLSLLLQSLRSYALQVYLSVFVLGVAALLGFLGWSFT